MYLSDEPGYYRDGAFGVRLESDLIVVAAEGDAAADARYAGAPPPTAGRKWLRFECVTKVPMCRALVDDALLSADERGWLDAYHDDVWRTLAPLAGGGAADAGRDGDGRALDADALATRRWLWDETRPL